MDSDGKNAVLLNIERDELLKTGAVMKLQPMRTATVTVKDASGNPVQGASVTCVVWRGNRGYHESQQHTNADGVAVFGKLISDTVCEFTAKKKGLLQKSSRSYDESRIAVGSSGWSDKIEIILVSAPVVKGKVLLADGSPAAGAAVQVLGWQGGKSVSDENGSFAVELSSDIDDYSDGDNPTIGFKFVSADRLSGLVQYVDSSSVEYGDSVFRLKPTRTLEVIAEDVDGKPLAGVCVSIIQENDRFSMRSNASKVTEADGSLKFDGLCPGDILRLSATRKGLYCSGKTLSRVGSSAWEDTIKLRLERAERTQKGKVVDGQGKPVVGASVSAWLGEEDQVSTKTDANGEFELAGLPDSSIGLSAQKGNLYGWSRVSKDTKEVTISLEEQDF